MKKTIAVIDYGKGNLLSVQKAFEFLGFDATITSNSQEILDASHVVLPGVGAFADCMKGLELKELVPVVEKVYSSGRPLLGICVGLQMFFTESEEFSGAPGLGFIDGTVKRFDVGLSEAGEKLKVPHMGWNTVSVAKEDNLFNTIDDNSYFYFVHSYYVIPEKNEVTLTTTSYGGQFVSSISKDNLLGCQFHPEKSQKSGLKLLKNFGDLKS